MITDMLAEITILLYLLSGSFFAAVFFSKKFEETISITILSSVCITFLFGMLGKLYWGFAFCLFLCIGLYFLSVIKLFRCKNISSIKSEFLTPSLLLFCILYVVIIILVRGRVATNSDEFSHWMECVKAMTIHNDFSTNPLSHDDYRSYPPGMSLFQYIVERIYLIFNSDVYFSEWVVYFAYQVFSVSLYFPFLKKIEWRRVYVFIFVIVGAYLTPSIFYNYVFSTVTIDPFVAILGGVGISTVVLLADSSVYSAAVIALMCVNLCLAKDVGIVFSIIMMVIYTIKINMLEVYTSPTKRVLRNIVVAGLPIVSMICCKKMWAYQMIITNTQYKGVEKYLVKDFFDCFFLKNGTDYKQTIVDNYKEAIVNADIAGISFLGGI